MLSDLREVRRYSLTLRAISWQRCLLDIWTTTPSTFFWDQLGCFLWIWTRFEKSKEECSSSQPSFQSLYWLWRLRLLRLLSWIELIAKFHIFNTQSVIIDNNVSVVVVLLPQFWFVKVQNWICFVFKKHTGQSQAPEVKENTNKQIWKTQLRLTWAPEVKENTNTQENTQVRLTCPPTSPISTWPEKV